MFAVVGGEKVLKDEAALRRIYSPPAQSNLDKEVAFLDRHCRDFIAHAPFAVLGTADGLGRVDTSPKGGPPGFAIVLDDRHLAIPDMNGNHRIDSLRNIVRCPGVSLLFLIPGVGETLRVVGRAIVSTEPSVLEQCRIETLVPNVAVVVEVTTAYIHCAKALRRSGLWEPTRWPDTMDMATPACMFRDHMRLPGTTAEVQEFLDDAYAEGTWAMGPATDE
jgi:PPOX class probable FMN-dependent enzyme